jgi:hypothetical protein
MPRQNSTGKGDLPRPVNKRRFDAGYERAFGKDCGACNGRGYHWDENSDGGMSKNTCMVCMGTGKVPR